MTCCHIVDSFTGAKLGPPTPLTSSLSNHETNFLTQSSGTITSSSVNSINSELVELIAILHASALVLEPSSSMNRILCSSQISLPGSFLGPTTTTSISPE